MVQTLKRATLFDTNLSGAKLAGSDFTEAKCGGTIFANTDLSEVKGLETVKHHSASPLGIDTLQRFKGNIPEQFLLGCGIPKPAIKPLFASLRSKSRAGQSIGSWMLRYRLGQGGNGDVWEAQNKEEIVVVKILRPLIQRVRPS